MMMCPYLFRHKRWISWNFQHLQRLPASLQGEEWSAANWGNSKADKQAMGTADGAQCLQFMNCIKKCFTFIYILCVWMFCVCLCPWRVKGCQISWNWGYRQLWNTIWVISIKPTYSRSTIVPSLQPPHKLFQSNYLNLPLIDVCHDPFGKTQPFYRDHIMYPAFQKFSLWFMTIEKFQIWSSNKNNFVVGVITTQGTLLKCCGTRKVENHCSRVCVCVCVCMHVCTRTHLCYSLLTIIPSWKNLTGNYFLHYHFWRKYC
jgi:hypothetical protein